MAGVMPIILGSGINRTQVNVTISSNTSNYTFNTSKITSGYDPGKTDATLTINSGVIVNSTSTGSYALTVDTSWDAGDKVIIVNNGVIVGRGGNGGNGGPGPNGPGTSGTTAGPALLLQRATSIDNLNIIGGGGGGGGGGGSQLTPSGKGFGYLTGGGGGGGITNGSGGTGGSGISKAPNGSAGTLTSAGAGGGGDFPGGAGGSYGSSGSNGTPGGNFGGGSGGAAGAAIVGSTYITYINVGTINGSVS
jgi:hypothetical protein